MLEQSSERNDWGERQELSTALAILGRQREAREIPLRPDAVGQELSDPPDTPDSDPPFVVTPFREAITKIAAQEQLVVIMEAHTVSEHRAWIGLTLGFFRAAGFTDYFAETIAESGSTLKFRGYPTSRTGFYTLDPRFGNLVRTAIRLGFEVGGYDLFERDFDRREEYQAATLAESGVSMGRSVLMRTSNRRPFEFRTNGLQLSGSRSRKSELQGSLLFEDTKFGEEFSDLGSVATNCLGDIGRAGGPEEANRRISDSGHYFRTGTLSDPACILPESDVTHVMGTILD